MHRCHFSVAVFYRKCKENKVSTVLQSQKCAKFYESNSPLFPLFDNDLDLVDLLTQLACISVLASGRFIIVLPGVI